MVGRMTSCRSSTERRSFPHRAPAPAAAGWAERRSCGPPDRVRARNVRPRTSHDEGGETMPLIGEWANTAGAFQFDEDHVFSYSWVLEFAPSAAYPKICLTDAWDLADKGAAGTGIVKVRRRLPDNSDQTLEFPPVISNGSIKSF